MSDEQTPLMPDDIRRLFEKHWIGSEDDLDTALEAFYKDITSSIELTMDSEAIGIVSRTEILTTLHGYITNHYF